MALGSRSNNIYVHPGLDLVAVRNSTLEIVGDTNERKNSYHLTKFPAKWDHIEFFQTVIDSVIHWMRITWINYEKSEAKFLLETVLDHVCLWESPTGSDISSCRTINWAFIDTCLVCLWEQKFMVSIYEIPPIGRDDIFMALSLPIVVDYYSWIFYHSV